ncbi:hypothetical protein RUND412_009530, partial [Rhizina undulata]
MHYEQVYIIRHDSKTRRIAYEDVLLRIRRDHCDQNTDCRLIAAAKNSNSNSNISSNEVMEIDPEYANAGVERGRDDFYDSDYESAILESYGNVVTQFSEGRYLLPNDEGEQNRMEIYHFCCLLALQGKLFIAPVGEDWSPQRILDVGTGSGTWAVDIAEQYPCASVTGVDLSPIQPNWEPHFLTFEIYDVEDPWVYPVNHFHMIHIRNIAGAIYDWPNLYRQAFSALKPGNWLELQEFTDVFSTDDDSLPPTSSLIALMNHLERALSMSGREYSYDLGYVEVREKVMKAPIDRWPKGKEEKELGTLWRKHFLQHTQGITLGPFTRVLGW